jgi:apolipoprotein N-acyltransferase
MSLWGALGLSFLVVGLIAGVVEIIRNKKNPFVWIVFLMFFGMLVYGRFIGVQNMNLSDLNANEQTTILRIVQPGESQLQKATHNRAEALQRAEYNLRNLMSLAQKEEHADIIIMPETSYPFVVLPSDNIEMAKVFGVPVIFGANTFDMGGVFNSMVVSQADGRIEKIYSKSHLVPFGEYKPLGFLPSPANLTAGNGPEIINLNGFMFAPAICYEIIFSDSLLPYGAGQLDAIINITGGMNLTLFEAEQAAEVVRAASNTDINTIFGSVINENLTDEVIVTVIATGFDKSNKEPLYNTAQTPTRRIKEVEAPSAPVIDEEDNDDEDNEFELPPFLRNRNY